MEPETHRRLVPVGVLSTWPAGGLEGLFELGVGNPVLADLEIVHEIEVRDGPPVS